MKILIVGDPHGSKKIEKIPIKKVDLILITGDLGKADLARKRFFENIKRKKEGLSELEWDKKFQKTVNKEIYDSSIYVIKYFSKFAPTYSILGNVGTRMMYKKYIKKDEKEIGLKIPNLREGMKKIKDFNYVKNTLRNINGLKIGFLEWFTDTNWVQDFKPSDYKKELKKAKIETEKARKILKNLRNLEILICHQPPYEFLDKVSGKYGAPKHFIGKHAGSKTILNYIKKYQPKYVFCGHIHEGEGKIKIGKTEVYNLGVAGYKIINL